MTFILLLALSFINTPCQAAVEFDGINDSIDIIDSDTQDLLSNFTISAWAKSTGPTEYSFIFGTADASDLNGYYITIHDVSQKAIVYSCDAVTCSSAAGTTNIKNDSTWHHIVGTFNGTNLDVYVDEIKEGSTASTRTPTNNILTQRIGGSHFWGRNFRGEIDDVRIYNRALSISEIETLYNSRSKRPSGSIANGLTAHYEMDDDAIGEVTAQAKDSSGNLNHGQFIGFDNLVSNGFSANVPAQIGTGDSLKFDGINDYLSTSTNLDDSLSSGFTISTWINANTINDDEGIVSNYNGDAAVMTDRDGISIRKLNSNIRVLISDSGGGNYIGRDTSGNEINTATWHHIIASWNGSLNSSAIKIFVDNIQSDNLNVNSGIVNSFDQSGQPFIIGANQFAGSKIYFDGLIDETRIYNKSLSIPEISFLYNGSGIDPGTSNLQALWTFDDNSALKDSSGNDNHGVGVGGNSLRYSEGVLRR